ncbi:G-type lectin S-receptor-like serine/threonine-protein kinase LECRK3 [Punica granatum]|uniref:Receptor-like serine/threonine-protein kinase n=2 Tax=Punica granatum TaxID=22663 RepID=A0A6P8CT79_PUNGR|nr:G-type lectin S-receptor-like serine/threonine-protein kinase LECRK3 [Punica granatum]
MASASLTLLLLLFPILLSLATLAQAQGNITLDLSLTADDRNSSWKSPSGDFALGFQRTAGNGGFLLAIWFDKIPDKTVIWSANRDNLAPQGSKVELTREGRLVLNSPGGEEIWAASTSIGASNASMLDTGNFVLVNETGFNSWETFSHPSDTILPTQVLNQGTEIISSYSATNYSSGRFRLILQSDGNLVMHTRPVYDLGYWDSQTGGSGYQVIFNQTGQIYVTARNGSLVYNITSGTFSSRDLYQRAVLEYDGVFRQYVYPRNTSSSLGWPKAWTLVPSPVPPNICTTMRQYLGAGACGWNSYCILGDDQRPRCECPHRYSYIDPSKKMNGCKPDFLPQSCDEGKVETNLFTIRDMPNADWQLSDYERYDNQDENFCRQVCLDDCLCAVAIFRQGNCLKKRMPLSNGMVDLTVGGKALIKVRIDNSTSKTCLAAQRRNINRPLIIIGSAIMSSSALILLLLTFLIWFRYFHGKKPGTSQSYLVNRFSSMQSFTYKELREATGGFKEELGRGAYGAVYKGVLPSSERSVIAVKVLERITSDGDREFKTEVDTIGRTNHRNLVELIGFCNEGQNRLLVYEFMPNGSLADFLFGGSRPSWFKRIEIVRGIARGLLYLHEECSKQIIHCDIKPQNILLDESLTAKISDFGLSKLLKIDQTRTMTAVRGTKGYLAVEWFRSMPISVKVDVYSFGIVLLELICCRKNCEFELNDEAQMILSDWVYDCYHEDKVELIVGGDEEMLGDMNRVRRFVMIAMWCIQEEPSMRPSMKKVTQMLEGVIDVAIPPGPSSFISSIQ